MTGTPSQEVLRKLPGVDRILQSPGMEDILNRYPRRLVVEALRQVLDAKRKEILSDCGNASTMNLEFAHIITLTEEKLEALTEHTLIPVINASGIIVHTNLGRSLLPPDAMERLQLICQSYNNLEYDLEKGQRGSRYVHAEAVLCELTGAEAALVVNNNAGAVFLALNTLAQGREVIVSRGQLVEIGGSFRIPDVMRASGAILREVGCTNRTHVGDYEAAINDSTALLLKVHTSNYRIIGFTAEVPLEQLVALGRERGLMVMEDLGSGCFMNLDTFGLRGEPTVKSTVAQGVDVVTFSGDKLLGGPQAGIILGKKELIKRCRKNPLTRALRVDKMTLAALEATLRLYRDESLAMEKIPTLRMIATPPEVVRARAEELAKVLNRRNGDGAFQFTVEPCFSQVGGGALPGEDLPSFAVSVSSNNLSTRSIEWRLRNNRPPIIGRIESDRFLMDVRTLQEEDFPVIEGVFSKIFSTVDIDSDVGRL
ncbi:MAG: L-seryl-tRNA(Sec) selenium transferase [Deltaproteobacteria bacterium]|nr:L-seryl-tRNA(Sec) selenium transferase [Deltaproteobacteria bacterium]